MSMPQKRASQACTPCRTRKVRCNGKQPCQECGHLNIACTFRPRCASAASRTHAKPRSVISTLIYSGSNSTRPLAASTRERPGLTITADDEFFLGLLPDYWAYVYTTCPLISIQTVKDSLARRGSEAIHAAFSYAYAAATLAVASSDSRDGSTNMISDLISRALHICPVVRDKSQINLTRIVISVYLRIAFGVLRDRDMELFYHREAVTMLQIIGVDQPLRCPSVTEGDVEVWQRLHWVVFIFDQLSSIAHDRMSLITPPETTPLQDDAMPDDVYASFTRASALYQLVDPDFLSFWRDKEGSPTLTHEWIIAKQEAFDQQRKLVQDACPDLAPLQRADLVLTCQWLRLLVWQMATRKYLLRSDALQDYMLLYFPVQESVYLRGILRELEGQPLRVGIGFVRKLFEVVDSASDVLTVSAGLQLPEDGSVVRQWLDNTCHLIRYIQQSGKLNDIQRAILQQKLESLEAVQAEFGCVI
ncbi:uncharacterized protein DNG_06858 [Cephalotrichum gorgonifer]|uniref:Zn(2)-C6 fungal-type domain-containing protein n=1 Tax=Cephalotrichum gorgonifer TaxID=2041049 RepID=A0AAE8N0N9_9PEZI|nr:uncharacterized protein DNG_06858 [Cephalotrichum gorgonifer]